MSTFTVPVVTVKTVTKHPNADALDILTFEEIAWRCVDKIGLRKPGDLVVYIPIDALVDTKRPEFAFLAPRAKADGFARIRTMKLRGEISQGLVISAPPLLLVPTMVDDNQQGMEIEPNPGNDAAYHYGIIKYEPPPEFIPANAAGLFPSWCQKSDAERYQNFNRNIQPFADEEFFITKKMDGTSCTVFYDAERENPLGVCSRNLELKEDDLGSDKYFDTGAIRQSTNTYWKIAREKDLLQKVKDIATERGCTKIALQGEICGPGIQGNRAGLNAITFYCFDIFDGIRNEYLPYSEFLDTCRRHSIDTVPVIAERTIREDIETGFKWISGLKYDNGLPAEGAVYVAKIPREVGNLGRLKFKFINPEFLLKYE